MMHNGQTPLMMACSRNYASIVSLLVEFDQTDVNLSSLSGKSPLHFAVDGLFSQIVELLVSSGADCNQKTKNGSNTPLHFLLFSHKIDKVRKKILKNNSDF